MPAESRLQTAIVKAMRDAGYYAVVNHGSAYTGAGRPDITVDAHGTAVWIEVKTETSRLTPRQEVEISKIRRQGGYAFVARTVRGALLGVSAARQGRLHMAETAEWSIDDFLKDLDVPVLTDPTVPTDNDKAQMVALDEFSPPYVDDPEPEPVPANVSDLFDPEQIPTPLFTAEFEESRPVIVNAGYEYSGTTSLIDLFADEPLPEPESAPGAYVLKTLDAVRPVGLLEGIAWDLAELKLTLRRIEETINSNMYVDPGKSEDEGTVVKRRRGRPPKVVAE